MKNIMPKLIHRLPRYPNKSKKYDHNYKNRVLAKSISSKLSFNTRIFLNVNFRGSRLRSMTFKSSKFILCDFSGVIFNKSRFKKTTFKKCVFYASIFRNAKFQDCKFEDCFFINTNRTPLAQCEFIRCSNYSYYDLIIPPTASMDLEFIKNNKIFKINRLLHLKGGKINNSTIFIITNYMNYQDFLKKLNILFEQDKLNKIYTTMKLLESLQTI